MELMETPEEERRVSAHFKDSKTLTWPEAMRTALNNKVSAIKEHTDHVTQSSLLAASVVWLYMSGLDKGETEDLVQSYREAKLGEIFPNDEGNDGRLSEMPHRSISAEMPEPVMEMIDGFQETAQGINAKRKEVSAIAFYGVLMADFDDQKLAGLVESYNEATMAEIFPERF